MYSSLALLNYADKGGSSCGLLETTCGMVIIRSGNPADNCFVYEKDPLRLQASHYILYTFHKAIQFLTTIMNLYSIQGDWILDGHCGTGKYMDISLSTCLNYFVWF